VRFYVYDVKFKIMRILAVRFDFVLLTCILYFFRILLH